MPPSGSNDVRLSYWMDGGWTADGVEFFVFNFFDTHICCAFRSIMHDGEAQKLISILFFDLSAK